MKQRLTNASKHVLGYIDVLHLKAVKSFGGSIASLLQRLQTSFVQEAPAVSKFVDDAGKRLIKLRRSIRECEAIPNGWLGMLIDGDLFLSVACIAVPEAKGTGGASGADPSK